MIETTGLSHIHILVRDMNRSLLFYQRVFGLEELFREDPDMVFLRTPGSRDLITLHQSDDEQAGEGGGMRHFGFVLRDAADLDDAVRAVEHAGGKLLRRAEHSPGHPVAYVSDPDGYVIEIGS